MATSINANEPNRQSTLARTQSAFGGLFARLLPTAAADRDSQQVTYPALPTGTPQMPGGFLIDPTPRMVPNSLGIEMDEPDELDELDRLANGRPNSQAYDKKLTANYQPSP